MSTNPHSSMPEDQSHKSSMGLLLFSWLFVGVPLAWGVIQTIYKSMALFK